MLCAVMLYDDSVASLYKWTMKRRCMLYVSVNFKQWHERIILGSVCLAGSLINVFEPLIHSRHLSIRSFVSLLFM